MPESIVKYKIFIASPSDVADERASIDDVVTELNQTFASTNNIVLELIKWETHSAPGMSVEGAQDVINKDVGTDYDLFIGILWAKFGTPTTKANSGTEEEFDNAFERFKKNPNNIQILFYFKTTAPISILDIDPTQLMKVQKFKASLGKKGGLYWEYSTMEDLQKFLRLHIPKRINELMKKNEDSILEKGINKKTESTVEELGLIDYQEIIEDSFSNATKAIERIADSVTWIGNEIQKKTDEATKFAGKDIAKKVLRDYFRRTAKVLDDFAERMNPDIQIFSSNFEEGADAISKILSISRNDFKEIDQEEFDSALDSLISMDSGINSGLTGVIKFLEAVKALPRMEKEMNKARKNVESQLELLANKMELSLTLSSELQKELV